MKSPEFAPRPQTPQEGKKEKAEQKIIAARRALARSQEFVDKMREELMRTEDKDERARITAGMREAALEIQTATDIIESASADLAPAKKR